VRCCGRSFGLSESDSCCWLGVGECEDEVRDVWDFEFVWVWVGFGREGEESEHGCYRMIVWWS